MIDSTRASLLTALAELSEVAPDMRFGQTISNLVTKSRDPGTQAEWAEAVWDIEDSELLDEVIRTTANWKEAAADSPPTHPLPIEHPSGEGRSPVSVRRTWSMLIDTMLAFADENESFLRDDRDRDAITALRRSLDIPTPAPTGRRPSLAS